MEIHHLYKITNNVNDKVYIGVTTNPERRKLQHLSDSKSGRIVNKAVRKYGKENFTFDVICTGEKEYIYDLEQKAIILYNSLSDGGWGYNICIGGVDNRGKRGGVKYKVNDVSVFVSGFWFPNPRTAMKSLNWSISKYNSRKRDGNLWKIAIPRVKYIYAMGFWFAGKEAVKEKLNLTEKQYNYLLKTNQLGSDKVTLIQKKNKPTKEFFYKGFWFPDSKIPSTIFDVKETAVKMWYYRNIADIYTVPPGITLP